jgi:hypothetical protein
MRDKGSQDVNNPIAYIKSLCKENEDGYPILYPDIDINAIMKQFGYSNPVGQPLSKSSENVPQNENLNNHKQEQ